MNREMELEKLIAEQARDDRDFQPPQTGTVPYGHLLDVMDHQGRVRPDVRREYDPGCKIHGMLDQREDPTRGAPVCRLCDRERKSRARRANGDRMRALDRARKARNR
jgi:hypothetical protein